MGHCMEESDLVEFLTRKDSFWKWDGHKYVAELTSGKLSDFFANLTPIFTVPFFQERVGTALANKYWKDDDSAMQLNNLPFNSWVVGSAMGSIGLAQSVCKGIIGYGCKNIRAAFTEKKITSWEYLDRYESVMELKRFDLGKEPFVILIEDVTTTGKTSQQTHDAILAKHPDAEFSRIVLSVIDRSVTPLWCGFVTSLMKVEPQVWDSLADLPAHMRECIPLRPKANWKALVETML